MKVGRFILCFYPSDGACRNFLFIYQSHGLPYHFGSIVAAIMVAFFPHSSHTLTYMGLDKYTSQFVGFLE